MASAPAAPLVAVVEDDASYRRAVARLLLAADLQPISYVSAEELLADGPTDRFDCLVLDIQLGGLSGIDLTRRLSEDRRGAGRIVILTAHDGPKYREDAASAGCTAFLSKSAPAAELLAAVRKAAAGSGTCHGKTLNEAHR